MTPEFTARDRWLDRVSAVVVIFAALALFAFAAETIVAIHARPLIVRAGE
ncbi:MAG: hypothetical protein PF443_09290 [Allgaiera sp.]|jgi:hypothetical protein|nr:hypothetical protein [Allgaiera sp.]